MTETAAAAIRHKRHNEERNDNDGHGRRSDYEATESLEREKFPVIAFEAARDVGRTTTTTQRPVGGRKGGKVPALEAFYENHSATGHNFNRKALRFGLQSVRCTPRKQNLPYLVRFGAHIAQARHRARQQCKHCKTKQTKINAQAEFGETRRTDERTDAEAEDKRMISLFYYHSLQPVCRVVESLSTTADITQGFLQIAFGW